MDISDEIKSIFGGVNIKDQSGQETRSISHHCNIDIARKQIHQLMASDELRHVHTLAIVLNCKSNTPVYDKIYSKDKRMSMYIKKLTDAGIYDNKEPEELPDERDDDPTHKLASENKK